MERNIPNDDGAYQGSDYFDDFSDNNGYYDLDHGSDNDSAYHGSDNRTDNNSVHHYDNCSDYYCYYEFSSLPQQ